MEERVRGVKRSKKVSPGTCSISFKVGAGSDLAYVNSAWNTTSYTYIQFWIYLTSGTLDGVYFSIQKDIKRKIRESEKKKRKEREKKSRKKKKKEVAKTTESRTLIYLDMASLGSGGSVHANGSSVKLSTFISTSFSANKWIQVLSFFILAKGKKGEQNVSVRTCSPISIPQILVQLH
jgi:hypothetical protein